jgi:hypothetical protein
MRQPLTAERLQDFMGALAAEARTAGRVYLVGGASALLLGWRTSTIDVDLKFVPELDETLRSLPMLKERLQINIELASPEDFIPALPGWEDRSRFIRQQGKLSFYHYDFYAQALAKIERGHDVDLIDVDHFFERGLIEPTRLLELFSAIEDQIYRYPELNPESFRRAVEAVVRQVQANSRPIE